MLHPLRLYPKFKKHRQTYPPLKNSRLLMKCNMSHEITCLCDRIIAKITLKMFEFFVKCINIPAQLTC